MVCGTLVLQPGIEPVPPAVEAQSLNHWTAREVPFFILFFWIIHYMVPLTLVTVYRALLCVGHSVKLILYIILSTPLGNHVRQLLSSPF